MFIQLIIQNNLLEHLILELFLLTIFLQHSELGVIEHAFPRLPISVDSTMHFFHDVFSISFLRIQLVKDTVLVKSNTVTLLFDSWYLLQDGVVRHVRLVLTHPQLQNGVEGLSHLRL